MITVVIGKEIEKIKGDFESYLNGLNMVGKISYSQYSELYDEGTKQIQKAYELGKSELEKENARLNSLSDMQDKAIVDLTKTCKQRREHLTKAKELLKWALHSDPEHDEDFEKKWSEAEQFLNDSKQDG